MTETSNIENDQPKITKSRKLDHVIINLEEDVQFKSTTTGLEDIHFVHEAFPELHLDEIDLSIELFGKKLQAPVICSGMTGGHADVAHINELLGINAEAHGIGMGVGSQRAGIEDDSVAYTFSIARKVAPSILLIGNLGAPQLVKGYGLKEVQKAIDMIQADVMAIHTNPLQETVQEEGDKDFRGVLEKIDAIARELSIPVIVKEVGSGFSRETAKKLNDLHVAGIDIQGAGGTSWSAVEAKRARTSLQRTLGELYWDWGIPTVISTVEVRSVFKKPIIASGGVRNGLDAAKLLALGADAVGMASPFLKAAHLGLEQLKAFTKQFIQELKLACFLTGAASVKDLQNVPLIITGKTSEWLERRGYDLQLFAEGERPWKVR